MAIAWVLIRSQENFQPPGWGLQGVAAWGMLVGVLRWIHCASLSSLRGPWWNEVSVLSLLTSSWAGGLFQLPGGREGEEEEEMGSSHRPALTTDSDLQNRRLLRAASTHRDSALAM